jgi:hypothetical protein
MDLDIVAQPAVASNNLANTAVTVASEHAEREFIGD